MWAPVAGADFAGQRAVLDMVWTDLIGSYGDMSATVAADMLDDWLEGGAKLKIVRPVDEERANARMRWAIGEPDPYGNLTSILDELVKQPARSSVISTAQQNGMRYARVPSGADTCSWCLMLASRGGEYRSRQSAGQDRKFHGDCSCTVVPVIDESDYPEGYDPDALYDRYAAARNAAGSGDPKKILAQMREREGIH